MEPGETKTVTFEVPMEELYYWDEEQDKRIYDLGEYRAEVGASSQDIKLTGTFTMEGELDRKLNVITASPDRFIFDLDKGVTASGIEVTANMNDETFYDVEKAEVRYESSNEEVATVNGEERSRP